jgi:site-specific DNA recombinase
LIFSKLARLARNTKELLEFADIFRDHQADLVSLEESIDTSSPAGRLLYVMIGALAQWEREEIAARVAASVPIRAKLGKPLGGASPYGYRWKDRKLVPDEKEAPIRKLVHELFLEHKRKKTVARLLNERGYRTRNGSKFSDTTVDRLLRDQTAMGIHRANYSRTLGAGKPWQFKPESDWVFNTVPAIVSEELWTECNRILDVRRYKRTPIARKPVHLFAGVATCHCGAKMYVPANTPKYVCYRCRNKIPIIDLDGIFQEQLKQFLFSPGEVADYLDRADGAVKEKEELLDALRKEALSIKADMDKVYRLYMSDGVTVEGFARVNQPLEERLKQIEGEEPRLQAEIDVLKIQYLSSDQILADSRNLHSRWPTLSKEDQRQIVETIVEQIVIGKDEVEIRLHGIAAPHHSDISTSLDDGKKATHKHGFIAATSCTRAG